MILSKFKFAAIQRCWFQNFPFSIFHFCLVTCFNFSRLVACNSTIRQTLSPAVSRQFSENFQNVYKTSVNSPLRCLILTLVNIWTKKYLTCKAELYTESTLSCFFPCSTLKERGGETWKKKKSGRHCWKFVNLRSRGMSISMVVHLLQN